MKIEEIQYLDKLSGPLETTLIDSIKYEMKIIIIPFI